ncbi:MAG: squalene/phytoene synthase family protein [bacterium]|nr:squalene/phytoene synthase family protein [bacterium]
MSRVIDEIGKKEKEITAKSKSSFLYSFSLLPKEKNDAINTVYAFCRKTDDIVDDENESEEKKFFQIKEWRNEFEKALKSGDSKYSILNSVNRIIKRFNIPVEPFFDLIKGMEMDLRKKRYNTFGELVDYCFNVASTVGLMCIEIFGYNNPKTKDFAINLGIALQLTNILRDIKSDAKQGRIYIPAEDLKKFNYSESDLMSFTYNENFIKLMKYECERAASYYEKANSYLTKEDKGLMFAARIMEHIYFRVLKIIVKKNYNIFDNRVRVSKLKKLYITAGVFVKYKLLYSFDERSLGLNGK